ncbi:TPA: hypothetical protein N0F65_000001 [Lagenidium giganteum]|uniref:Flavin-containing monooxygenase n=1 Tax=Lagenidium giganteum TaxID=4803 RepID=A0AAV2YMI8_9STRA|nr:TPA: hypothetical protein N0F65_000001 [Lagenidium giganteum]
MAKNATPTPRVGVVGAGASGLYAARHLRDCGLDVVVFEQRDVLGGIWNYSADQATGPCTYKSLRTNLPTEVMQVPGMRCAPRVGSYPTHAEMLATLETYAQDFASIDCIRFSTTVRFITKTMDGEAWQITVAPAGGDAYIETVDRVVVCNGHCTVPNMPDIPGMRHITGNILHSRDYRTPDRFLGQPLIPVASTAGHDISLELAAHGAAQVTVAVRDHDKRIVKPAIERIELDEDTATALIVFEDGTTMPEPDVTMFCTGYRHAVHSLLPNDLLFPNAVADERGFDRSGSYNLAKLVEAASRHEVVAPLYRHVFAIQDPTIAFIGLSKRTITLMCFELQAQWVARVFAGLLKLPNRAEMYESLASDMVMCEARKEPLRMFHCLGTQQKDYFSFLASQVTAELPEVLEEMFVDSAILMFKCPEFYRSVIFARDPATNKWIRTLQVPATKEAAARTDLRVFGEPYVNPFYQQPESSS